MDTLLVDPGAYSIYQIRISDLDLGALSALPRFHLSKTTDSYSIIAASGTIAKFQQEEGNWRVFEIKERMQFTEYGVLEKLLKILAEARVSVLVSSVFDTDYIFVKNECLPRAIDGLRKGGYVIVEELTV